MIMIYNKTKYIYWFVVLPSFIPFLLISIALNSLLFMPVYIMAVGIAIYFLNNYAVEAVEKNNHLFTHELETDTYISFYKKAVSNRFNREALLITRINLVSGYLASGEFQNALDICRSNRYHDQISKNVVFKVSYLVVCVACCLYEKNLLWASELISEIDKLLQIEPQCDEKSLFSVKIIKLIYNYENNEFENFEKECRDVIENDDIPLHIITVRYFLGCYYEHMGFKNQALQEFEYVSSNGKDLYLAKQARLHI